RHHRRPASFRRSRKQPDGAVRPRLALRQRLLAPRGHPIQRRAAAGGELDPRHGHQLVHRARHTPSRYDRIHHDHQTGSRDDYPPNHRPADDHDHHHVRNQAAAHHHDQHRDHSAADDHEHHHRHDHDLDEHDDNSGANDDHDHLHHYHRSAHHHDLEHH